MKWCIFSQYVCIRLDPAGYSRIQLDGDTISIQSDRIIFPLVIILAPYNLSVLYCRTGDCTEL